MLVNLKQDNSLLDMVPFKMAWDQFTYLAITVTRKTELLLRVNWHQRMEQLKQNIEFWKTLPVSPWRDELMQ